MLKKTTLILGFLFLLASCSKRIFTEPALQFQIPDTEIPLSEQGPYEYSMIKEIIYQDENRDDREISISILYPSMDDAPDERGAPFPLIINDYKMFNTFGEQLASHGFVVVGINKIGVYLPWDEDVFDQPLDYLFVLNQIAENPPEDLKGFIDTDHTGVWGYSYGGHNSLTLSGAKIDPEYYFEICEDPSRSDLPYGEYKLKDFCDIYHNWDEFVIAAGPELTESTDGMWQSITDDRITAILSLSPEGEWLRGPRGLAASDKTILVTSGTGEGIRYKECYAIYQGLGSSNKVFVTFIGKFHNMVFNNHEQNHMKHLAVAFFSYHLKGYEEYEFYFSEEFISQIDDLALGWYEEE